MSVLVRSGDCEALLLPSICQRLSKVLAVTSLPFLILAWQRNTEASMLQAERTIGFQSEGTQ